MSGMTYKISTSSNYRSQRGQAIIEGAVSFSLITGLVIAGILLIIGCYYAVFYKSKIAYAATLGANSGAQSSYFLGAKRKDFTHAELQATVTLVVNNTLTGLGMPQAKVSDIAVSSTTVNNVRGVQVSVKHDNLGIISGGLLPSNISLTETAFAPFRNEKPPNVLGLSIGGTSAVPAGQGLILPMYGGGNVGVNNNVGKQGPIPDGTFPYWKVQLRGEKIPAFSKGDTDYSAKDSLINPGNVEQYGPDDQDKKFVYKESNSHPDPKSK